MNYSASVNEYYGYHLVLILFCSRGHWVVGPSLSCWMEASGQWDQQLDKIKRRPEVGPP